MFKALTPIFALIIAAGLGFTYIQPQFIAIKAVQSEEKDYTEAIAKASELKALIDEKVRQVDSFNPVDLERLQTMLPDEVNEVSVVLDLDALARAQKMSLSSIEVRDSVGGNAGQVRQVAAPPPIEDPAGLPQAAAVQTSPFSSREISFTVTGTYEDFRKFVENLEQSLVFFDVVDLKFSESEGDLTAYAMTIRTYSFNPEK